MFLRKTARRGSCLLKILAGICVLVIGVVGIGLAIVIFWPDVAAQNIDRLRDVIGDAPVAQLEDTVLSVKDEADQIEYNAGLVKPAAPWTASQSTPDGQTSTMPTTQVAVGPTVVTPTHPVTPSSASKVTATPRPTVRSPVFWHLLPLNPLGNLAGEGKWSPYLYAADGKTIVAYRTFLQADPLRPYSVAAIVAFNLATTRLHFVLGTIEPVPTSPQPSRSGTISALDLQPGVLLATFNGGFKARHGEYGAMADGLIALPPLTGLATVAMYSDGHVQIGKWGTDLYDSPNLVAWRQNGEMLIYDGAVNPATADTSVAWGRTIKGGTITWRSALGISADGRTLYYVAGPQLDAPTLANVILQAGAAQALELDVNDYWVHFDAIRANGSTLVPEPLFKAMDVQADRYLSSWSRDFFYVTTAPQS